MKNEKKEENIFGLKNEKKEETFFLIFLAEKRKKDKRKEII